MISRLRSQLHSYIRMQYARTQLRLFPTAFIHQTSIYKDHTQGYSQMHSYTRMQYMQGPDSGYSQLHSYTSRPHMAAVPHSLPLPSPSIPSSHLPFPPPPLFDLFCWVIFTPAFPSCMQASALRVSNPELQAGP
jgi:hypothetical protein